VVKIVSPTERMVEMGGETMTSKRRRHGAKFKARVVLQALEGDKSINDLAGLYQVHPSQITAWKRHVVENMSELFSDHKGKGEKGEEALRSQLYEQIGKLKVELDWLKKKSGLEA